MVYYHFHPIKIIDIMINFNKRLRLVRWESSTPETIESNIAERLFMEIWNNCLFYL